MGRRRGIETGLQTGQPTKRGLTPSRGKRFFFLNAHIGYGVQLASYLVGKGDHFFGGKATGE